MLLRTIRSFSHLSCLVWSGLGSQVLIKGFFPRRYFKLALQYCTALYAKNARYCTYLPEGTK